MAILDIGKEAADGMGLLLRMKVVARTGKHK